MIDLSAQFIVNFVSNVLLYPSEDGYRIVERALLCVKLQDAIVGGMIDYASFDTGTKMAFDCALRMVRRIDDGGCSIELETLKKSGYDCLVILGINWIFKKMKNSPQYLIFYNALNDAKKYDLILKRVSELLSKDAVENFVQTLVENSIQESYED